MGKRSLNHSAIELQARLIRRTFRRWRQQLRFARWSLNGLPVIFANSFPKSGTHLLTQILLAFEKISPAVNCGLPAVVTYQGDTAQQRTVTAILQDLRRFLPGDIGYGHLHAQPPVVALLSSPSFASYFILRDPRDVVVSHVHYVTEMESRHALHDYYLHQLHSFEERLEASIRGLEDVSLPLTDIRQRFEPFLDWLNTPQVLTLRYEDLIQNRSSELDRILHHAVERGLPLHVPISQAIEIIEKQIDPKRSPTFRKGKIGGWQESFNLQHKRLFKDIAGDLLIRLGYETSHDW